MAGFRAAKKLWTGNVTDAEKDQAGDVTPNVTQLCGMEVQSASCRCWRTNVKIMTQVLEGLRVTRPMLIRGWETVIMVSPFWFCMPRRDWTHSHGDDQHMSQPGFFSSV